MNASRCCILLLALLAGVGCCNSAVPPSRPVITEQSFRLRCSVQQDREHRNILLCSVGNASSWPILISDLVSCRYEVFGNNDPNQVTGVGGFPIIGRGDRLPRYVLLPPVPDAAPNASAPGDEPHAYRLRGILGTEDQPFKLSPGEKVRAVVTVYVLDPQTLRETRFKISRQAK